MHQSSLGTLYVIVPDKLHGLWYTPLLPVFFFISAVAAGLAMTIFESFMSYRAFGKRLEDELLEGLARVIVVVLGVYGLWKFEDLAGRGNLGLAFQVTPESTLFWGEMGLGVILPMLLFAIPRVRHNRHGLFFGGHADDHGLHRQPPQRLHHGHAAAGRASATSRPGWSSRSRCRSSPPASSPSVYAVKYLPVFHTAEESDAATVPHRHGRAAPVLVPERRLAPVFRGQVLAGLWVLLFIGALAVGLTSGKRNGVAVAAINGTDTAHEDPAILARTAEMAQLPMELPPDYLFPVSEMSPGQVHFSHQSHVDTADPKCATCHTDMFSMQKPGMPLSGALSGDRAHENLCGSCHNGTNAFSVEDNCDACHQP